MKAIRVHRPGGPGALAERQVSAGIAEEVVRRVPGGVDGLLELVGTVTLLDSLRAVRPRGVLCNTGILGNAWLMERFEPLEDIPSTVPNVDRQSARPG